MPVTGQHQSPLRHTARLVVHLAHMAQPATCTSMLAAYVQGRPGAVSIIAMAERGALFDPGPCL